MEIEESAMEIEETLPSPSRKKHRSSSPAGEEAQGDGSKRRKHRHHHHHRRHHRHRRHSKKGCEIVDGEEAPPSSLPTAVADYEPEEGEILEEEEDGIRATNLRGSDAESGEIKSDLVPNPVTSGEDNVFSDKVLKAGDGNLNGLDHNKMNHDTSVRPCKNSRRKIDDVPILFDTRVTTKGKVPVIAGECEHMKTSRDELEKFDYGASNGDLTSRARSWSPVPGDSLYSRNHGAREDTETKFSAPTLERPREIGVAGRSPSRERHLRDSRNRNRSSSHGKYHERGEHDSRHQHRVRGQASDAEMDRSDRIVQDDRHPDYDREKEADRAVYREKETERHVYRERERSASYNRHEGQEDRRGNRDRESDLGKGHRDRERGRSSSISSRHDQLEDKHRAKEREREVSRGSVRDRERGTPRDLTRESSRDRDRDRGRDVYRDRDIDRGRDRNMNRDAYDRSRSRASDRDMHLDKGSEHGRQPERDRFSYRDKDRDSRRSRNDERDHHWDRMRFRDSTKATGVAGLERQKVKEESIREEDEENYQEKIEQQLAKQDEEDPDKIKEESRKRRQAILEKYKQRQSQERVDSPSTSNSKEDKTASEKDNLEAIDAKDADGQALLLGPEMKQDHSDVYVAEPSFIVGKSPMRNGTSPPDKKAGVGGLGEGTPKSERSADMFCDDIFGESPVAVRKAGKGDGLQIERSGLHDNWDDAEGYYSYRFGEVIDSRYEIIAAHGKGVFSTVVRAKDLKAGNGDPEEVAIKIIRNNDTMYKAGQEELIILKKLVGADPGDKRHCVRFLSSFKYRNHLCLVFESLHMNLREVLKKFGRNIGLRLTAVRAYAKQLFIALKHLKNCGVLHCDIKPDNMLVNEAKNVLKLCDFGNAMFAGKNEITPYLVSRFYRAPEIILGLTYDHPMDIWSVGCCLYELYSGKVLFPGPSNNEMLRLHMELKGCFSKKMLRKGAFVDQHFDQDLNFHANEEDPVTRKTVKRLLLNIKPKDISSLILISPGEDPKMLANFKDLLDKIFVLDPDKRIKVHEALSHPFITGK